MSKLIPFRRVGGAPTEMSDDALIAAVATGEAVALGALFDRHHAAMRAFLARMVGAHNPELDDLVQNTFVTIHKSAGRFRGKSSVKTWMFGIAMNVARHHIRGSARRKRLAEAYARDPEVRPASPAETAASREKAHRLEKAILELSPKLREAFVLVYLEGMAGKQASEILGVREGTIWKRLHEARAALRKAMTGDSKGDGA